MARRQGIFWILTISMDEWTPPTELPDELTWIRGQGETGEGGYRHWQLFVSFASKASLPQVTRIFGERSHAELSRSRHAEDYCWKEATRIEGTQFELGSKAFRRNSATDWDAAWASAVARDFMSIPASLRLRSYRTLCAIASDYEQPVAREVNTTVFWGSTGTGKTFRAWESAGTTAYCKDPRSKFWCGYMGEGNVIIDEFRGGIDISHLLRWLDCYPCRVEVKGSSRPLRATNFWITSNVPPHNWYPDVDVETQAALLRRMKVIEMSELPQSPPREM